MRLYEHFPDRINVNGREYRLTLFYDRVLRYLEMAGDKETTPEDIAEVGYEWLVARPKRVPLSVKSEVLERILREIIIPPRRQLRKKKKTQRSVDFSIDAAEIYSSFQRDYGIDLEKEQGRMHWCRFIALFEGLSEETPIKQIMRIRTQEIPAPTKHNAEQIARLNELKALYALPVEQSEQEQADAWGGLFEVMLRKAEVK